MPAIHCAPSVLKRKKFGERTFRVVSCAPDVPLMNVLPGCFFEYLATAIPSEPDSGPIRMSTLTCSTRRRASASATSGVASEHPNTVWIGWPPIVRPLTPLLGAFPAGLPPWSIRAMAPPSSVAS